MGGFLISNRIEDYDLQCYVSDSVYNKIENQRYFIARNTINKFIDDKPFYDDSDCVIAMEGVVLNKAELLRKYNMSFADAIKEMYRTEVEYFFNAFRGPFAGAYLNKDSDEWVVFTSHIGDSPVFYYIKDDIFFISQSINWIVKALKKASINYTLDEATLYKNLTYGFMVDDSTMINEIKRLLPGHCIKINSDGFRIERYHRFTNTIQLDENNIDENQLLDMIDEKFRRSVSLEYEKDEEYGYQHIANLSGGLDSRMNLWVAHDLGYKDTVAITFSQTNYLDEKIAKEVASFLRVPWIYKSLDDVQFIRDIDAVIKRNFGLSHVAGLIHGESLLKYLNWDKFGLLHTGQIGDAVLATHFTGENTFKNTLGANSTMLADRLTNTNLAENDEMFFLESRGLIAGPGMHFVSAEWAPPVSPFVDVDFFEFCLKIPNKWRKNHYIYKQWIIKKYPDAAKFKRELTNAKITDSKYVEFIKKLKHYGIKRASRYGLKKLKIKINIVPDKNDMNPYSYWYNHVEEMKTYMDHYFETHIDNKNISDKAKSDMIRLYNAGSAFEKIQVLSVLSTLKLYFSNDKPIS